jgi:hypothetical protein
MLLCLSHTTHHRHVSIAVAIIIRVTYRPVSNVPPYIHTAIENTEYTSTT